MANQFLVVVIPANLVSQFFSVFSFALLAGCPSDDRKLPL
jgi:hypothetical protein